MSKATGIKDINYALMGEIDKIETQQEEYVPQPATELPLPKAAEPKQEYVLFKLVNKSRNGGVVIPHIDYVINPEKPEEGVQMIRLLKGVSSIWAKDQKDLTKEFTQNGGNIRNLEFARGQKFLRIPIWDTALLEFAKVCRHNIGNPNRKSGSKFEFYEYDPKAVADYRLKKEMLEIDMAIIAKQQLEEKMKEHAAFLGIALVNEIGIPRSESEIRIDYIMAAKHRAKIFQDTLDSKEVKIQYKIVALIREGKIDLGREQNKAYWANSGNLISPIPQGRKAHEYLTDLALTNTENGKKFFESLQVT